MYKKFIVKSKNVFTGTDCGPSPAAILVNGKNIEAVLPYEYQGYPVFDYGESLIIPSFIDAHTHLFSGAIDASEFVCTDLGSCASEEECARMMADYAASHPDQKRLRGSGWFVGAWGDPSLPDKKSLDAFIDDRPVYLLCADSHSMWVNSKALEEMALPEDFDVPDGEVCRYENGEMTGLFLEPAAYAPAKAKYMEFSRDELIALHEEFQGKLAKYGISAVSEMMAPDYVPSEFENYEIIRDLENRGLMNSHVYVYTKLFGYTDFSSYFETKEKYDSSHLHIAGVKGFIDGVTETHTGLLLEPYTDMPDTCGDNVPLRAKELMQQEITAANKAGIQVRLHCIADGSVRMALDMYQASAAENDIVPLRNTVEHIENIHPDDIGRFKELGVVPSVQPYHLVLANNGSVIRLGKERCKYIFPNRTLYENSEDLAFGTDYPVVTMDPFVSIHAALTRCDDDGNPSGLNHEEQKLPLEVILKCYTINAARVYHCEDKMGSIEPGKMANFLVLSRNLFKAGPDEIEDTHVEVNYFEGREIYRYCDKGV